MDSASLTQNELTNFTTLTFIVQGVLEPGRIDGPYALDDEGSSGQSPTRCSATARLYCDSDNG